MTSLSDYSVAVAIATVENQGFVATVDILGPEPGNGVATGRSPSHALGRAILNALGKLPLKTVEEIGEHMLRTYPQAAMIGLRVSVLAAEGVTLPEVDRGPLGNMELPPGFDVNALMAELPVGMTLPPGFLPGPGFVPASDPDAPAVP